MRKPVLITFGGVSPEHEISVITGLQVVENIDKEIFEPHAIYFTKTGDFKYLQDLTNRKQFFTAGRKPIIFGHDSYGGYVSYGGVLKKKIYPYSAFLAFHGGVGESGGVQGLFETLNVPYTSTSSESAVVTMNKQLTKIQVSLMGVPSVQGLSLLSSDIKRDLNKLSKQIKKEFGLPVIIKPVHFGSSIGVKVAKTTLDLEQFLFEASHLDREILVEKFLTNFTEYNCAVRLINGKLQVSEIERPLSRDEILSFADKYQRGGKKAGAGMASLRRELPAKIGRPLKNKIEDFAKKAFIACRCKGMIRVDFMYTKDKDLYLTEINPIPGSMTFYLWEASGISFKQQITDLIEQSVRDHNGLQTDLDHPSDIIEKFVYQ